MARNPKEKLLSAELAAELVEKFAEQVKNHGFKQKRALQGAVELWLSLPASLQAHILSGECGEDVLAGMIRYIVTNRIDALREKLESLR